MAISLKQTSEAYNKLNQYDGNNPYLIDLKNDVFVYKKKTLNDFHIEYILKNIDKEPFYYNKIVKIAKWYGLKKQEEWNTEFIPEKLLISYYLGETDAFYHAYVKYRKSMEKYIPIFIPKTAILNPLFIEDFNLKEIDFSKYNKNGFKLKPQQEQAIKFLTTRKKGILALQMGGGKEIDINTLLPTPKGWVKADDIQIGDYLFASNGKPTKVLGKYYQGVKDIYEIQFTDDTKVNCGLEHLWITRNTYAHEKQWSVKSLKEILNEGLYAPLSKQQIEFNKPPTNKWQIPICNPVEYEEKKYFIDPYTLGILIGDGHLCGCSLCVSIPTHENETIERIASTLNENYFLKGDFYANCPRYIIRKKNHKNGDKNDYIQEIKRLGLNVIGHEKFIPDEYMLGSVDQRIALLQGLMDSDGYISKRKNKITFTSTSLRLINDMKLLVESLGGKCTSVYEDKRKNKYKKGCYCLHFQIRINPFRIKHKAERYTIDDTHNKYCNRRIKSVQKVRQSEAVCFYVDSEDHSFLTEHYVVTHNTIASIISALEDNYEKILVISPASVKTTWLKEIKLFENEENITVVEGSTWKEAKFTIINYDILDNFYEIPTEMVNRKVRNVDNNGKITYKTIKKEVVSKKSVVINEAMANSQLFQSKFDLIIIDEAHRLSNADSGRYKIIMDLIQRSKPKGIFELTGTMITNNPMNLYNILKIIDADITKDWQSYVKNYCDGKQIFVKKERDAFTNAFLKEKEKNTWNELTYEEKTELNEYLDKNCKKIWLTKGASNLDELKERIKHLYLRDLNEDIYKNFKKETKVLSYDLKSNEKIQYKQVWEEYINSLNEEERDINKILNNKKLIEGSVLRQATSQMMIPYTIKLTESILNNTNDKIIIFCAFDKEIYELKEYFNDKCVVHNGKLTTKTKEKAIDKFKNDDNCRILLGNLVSTSVGLNLIVANHVIFNSVSWLPAENQQAEYRILRIGQTKNCTIYYQKLNDTYMTKMFELLKIKNEIIDAVIVDEKNK